MTIEKLSDLAPGEPGIVRRWIDELDLAKKWQQDWQNRAEAIVRRYRGDIMPGRSQFNILHSNTETLRPALFAQRPKPDIRRRRKLPEQVEQMAAQVVEQGIEYQNDTMTPCYESEVNVMLNDYLLTGRGVMRIRYTPTFVTDKLPLIRLETEGDEPDLFLTNAGNQVDPATVLEEDGEIFANIERVQFERADHEHVPYDQFRHCPARAWGDVRWIAFRHHFTHAELKRKFGQAAADGTSYTVPTTGIVASDPDRVPDMFLRAEVWEIWDKDEREIIFMSEGNPERPLAVIKDGPDAFNLEGFFPTPKPLYSIESPGSLEPVPEFTIYQDLANELDDITDRMASIIETIDVKGAYDGSVPEIGYILDNPERLLAIENWRAVADKGGIDQLLGFIDIKPQFEAVIALGQHRDRVLQTIFEVVGISDIARATSDARETATAQRLKAQFGQFRLAPRQRAIQRYLRDLMRIQGEIIAEKFEPSTLGTMIGQEVPEEVIAVLRNNALRQFAIDIETDSTIAVDQQREQQQVAQLLEGLGAFGQASAVLPDAAAQALLVSIVRKFKLGPDVELALEEASGQQQQPTPDDMAKLAKQQNESRKLDIKEQEIALDYQAKIQELALEARELAMKEGIAEADIIQAIGSLFASDSP